MSFFFGINLLWFIIADGGIDSMLVTAMGKHRMHSITYYVESI